MDKFRKREIACYKNDLRKKWFEIKYVSCYTKSSIHTISPAIKPALVSAGTESASSCGTHMGAFLILPLPLKDLTGNEETEGDLGWISLMTGEGNNQLNASVFTGSLFYIPTIFLELKILSSRVQIILKTALYSFTLPWFPRLYHPLALPHP